MSSSNAESIWGCYQKVEEPRHETKLAILVSQQTTQTCDHSKMIKELLTDASVDTNKFSAHSTRAAASSSARAAGLSTADIMKMAGWSWQSTFEKFYHKPIMPTNNVVVSSAINVMSSNNTQCHICSLVMTWNCRSHKHPKDVQWDRNSISDKASIWHYPPHLCMKIPPMSYTYLILFFFLKLQKLTKRKRITINRYNNVNKYKLWIIIIFMHFL